MVYLVLFMLSRNLFNLIIAEFFSALAFGLKDVADLSLLNESIPETSKKSKIFAKLTGKGVSGYFVLNSISLIISGFLFAVNGYLPILISLGVVIISFLLSMLFIEPISDELEKYKNDIKDKKDAKQIIKIFKIVVEDFKSSVKFIMKSKRLQSLMIFSSIMSGFICILIAYQVNIYEELNISPSLIGIIFAALEIIAAICSKKHDVFQNKFTNKSLTVLGTLAAATCISIGICSCFIQNKIIAIVLITISLAVKYVTVGIYQILIDNYYTNFTNEEIDTKVFSTKL